MPLPERGIRFGDQNRPIRPRLRRQIHHRRPGAFQRQFRGKIYDVRVWNTTRTPEQIASAYDRLLTGDEEGLVANWQLAVKSGDNIVDVTGRYPATLVNIKWSDLDNL